MRSYETMFIVHPEVVGDEFKALVEKFKGVITDQGAEILRVDEWGSRTLAYPIQKNNKGSYVIFYFQAGPQVVAEFERRLRIEEKILRFTSLRHDEGFPQPAVAEKAEAQAAEEQETEGEEAGE